MSRFRRTAAPRAVGAPRARRRLVLDIAIAAAILVLLVLVLARVQPEPQLHAGSAVIGDGDSLRIGAARIRLSGIDAPELAQTCRRDGIDYPCGRQARDALRRLAGERLVHCSGSERDRHGRLLAVCRAGDVELNRAIVEEGWAVSYGDYRDAEAAARARGVGLWAGEFDRPRDWRIRHGEAADIAHGWAARLWSLVAALFTRG